jgi:hypothetical protein
MYRAYQKEVGQKETRFRFHENVSVFGCNEGFDSLSKNYGTGVMRADS